MASPGRSAGSVGAVASPVGSSVGSSVTSSVGSAVSVGEGADVVGSSTSPAGVSPHPARTSPPTRSATAPVRLIPATLDARWVIDRDFDAPRASGQHATDGDVVLLDVGGVDLRVLL